MKTNIKIEDFYFNQESLLENTGDMHLGFKAFEIFHKVSLELPDIDFSNIMFSMFSDYYKKFNQLPYIGHVFYLEIYKIFIAIDYYQQETNTKKLGVIFKILSIED